MTAPLPSRAMVQDHNQRFSQQVHLGLGQPQSRTRVSQRNAYSSTFLRPSNEQSSNELILYSYAQLVGTVLITPEGTDVVMPTQEQRDNMNKIRRALLRRRVVVGGGSMDILPSLRKIPSMNFSLMGESGSQHTNQIPIPGSGYLREKGPKRSVSLSSSLISFLSPTSDTTPETMCEHATTTSPNHLNGSTVAAMDHKPTHDPGPGGGTGLGLGIMKQSLSSGEILEDIDPELPLPTFEAQPSMLAVDLSLSPGESKSCTSLRRRDSSSLRRTTLQILILLNFLMCYLQHIKERRSNFLMS